MSDAPLRHATRLVPLDPLSQPTAPQVPAMPALGAGALAALLLASRWRQLRHAACRGRDGHHGLLR